MLLAFFQKHVSGGTGGLPASVLVSLILLLIIGCKSPHADTATPDAASIESPQPTVDALDLQVRPRGVDTDNRPGDEGVQVKLFLWRNETPLAARLERGTIEFLLHEGNVAPDKLAETEPARVWRYSAPELNRFAADSAFGVGYSVALLWGDQPPATPVVTLSARLLNPDEESKTLYAKPVLFTLDAR